MKDWNVEANTHMETTMNLTLAEHCTLIDNRLDDKIRQCQEQMKHYVDSRINEVKEDINNKFEEMAQLMRN